jgi:hypothetical protein
MLSIQVKALLSVTEAMDLDCFLIHCKPEPANIEGKNKERQRTKQDKNEDGRGETFCRVINLRCEYQVQRQLANDWLRMKVEADKRWHDVDRAPG